MTVCTSNHKYDIVSFCELEEKYQKIAMEEFFWVEALESSYGFFVYKKELYHLGQFTRHNGFLTDAVSGKKFYSHGIINWSAFNGLAIAFVDNNEAVKVAYYY